MPTDEQGLFLIGLSFGQDDMLYRSSTSAASEIRQHYRQRNRSRRNTYYSDPNSPGYIRAHGRAYKALIVSDIGLTYKRGHEQHLVYATRIDDAQPLSDVEVRLRTYQNQVAARGTTNDRGLARFEDVGEEIFYVEAEHQGSAQRDQTQRHGLESVELGHWRRKVAPGHSRLHLHRTRRVPPRGCDQHLGHRPPPRLHLPR